ncbi:MAG: hypothetical protein LBV12_01640 [Puniceicoccales bacterium]|jgi:hypothetical protein|nr:hypothetical protein [Puniceicoccales bacterium]
MKKILCLYLLAFVAWAFPHSMAQASPTDGLKHIFTLDADQPTAGGVNPANLPELYEYPQSAVTSGYSGSRKTFFADILTLRLAGADPQAKYAIRGTFLSDGGRILELKSTDEIVADDIVLPNGKPLVKEWLLPASSYTQTQGVLVIQFNATAGPNAVIQKLEVFSDSSNKLTLEANPPKKPFVLDVTELDHIVDMTPIPRISPRPTSVAGVAEPLLSLNGTWKFSPDGNATQDSKNIEVPGEWAMQGFDVPKRAFAEYYRTFDMPADWEGKVVRLRFDAVHAVCKVFVNGQEIGGHEGGFVPFELDVSSAVKVGTNEIRVKVQSESIADSVACMSQYAAHQVGGIIRKVTLFALPRINIADQTWDVKFDKGFKSATLTINTSIATNPVKGMRASLRHDFFAPNGKHILEVLPSEEEKKMDEEYDDTLIAGFQAQCEILTPNPLQWTPETPNLHTLKTTLLVNGKPAQTITQRIGFRQVEIQGNTYLVNGKPVKLLGVCRHEVHPLRGRSLTPELCREDALLYREGNCNFIRTSHYPPSEEFLDACDELGLFVECEAAITWIKHGASPVWKTWNHLDPKYLPYFLQANLDNVVAHRGHPSVIQWSLANESLWTPLFDRVNQAVKKLDPTRPTAFHDQCWGGFNNGGNTADVANYHYPSENNPDSWSKESRPVIFGEYVHLQCYNRRELVTDPFIREDWGRPTARMVDLMWEQPGLVGGSIWSGIDDVFHLPNGELRGYGHWGPIDGWRRKKPEWYGMKKAYSPVKILGTSDPSLSRKLREPFVIQLQNRYNFLDLKDARITWKSGDKTGVVQAFVPPHGKGKISIPADNIGPYDPLELIVTDPRGFVSAHEVVLDAYFPKNDPKKTPNTATDKSLLGLHENEKEIAIDISRNGSFAFAKKSPGKWSFTSNLGQELPASVDLMILPLNGSGGASGPAGSVLSNTIDPFTPVCSNVQKQRLSVETQPLAPAQPTVKLMKHVVKMENSYDEAEGAVTFTFLPVKTVENNPAGEERESYIVSVNYSYTLKKDINPRQWGLVFTLPRSFDTLSWSGKGTWTTAPADSIGRATGTAKANPVVRNVVEEMGKDLSGTSWAQDANALGTNDFRSTKAHIYNASLSNGTTAFVIGSDGTACTRAWVDGDSVKFLVAGFNTGGTDGFFQTHYSKERRPLKAGNKIEGSFFISVGR